MHIMAVFFCGGGELKYRFNRDGKYGLLTNHNPIYFLFTPYAHWPKTCSLKLNRAIWTCFSSLHCWWLHAHTQELETYFLCHWHGSLIQVYSDMTYLSLTLCLHQQEQKNIGHWYVKKQWNSRWYDETFCTQSQIYDGAWKQCLHIHFLNLHERKECISSFTANNTYQNVSKLVHVLLMLICMHA